MRHEDYPILDDTTLIKTLYDKITELGIPVLLSNPDANANFPCVVMQSPISKPRYMGASWDISITLEVWGNKHFDLDESKKEAAEYFTELKSVMRSINFQCVSQIPAFTDILIHKIRYGGYFEARWNATTNEFERRA